MKEIVFAYIPVLHDGYRKFIEAHKNADTLFLWGSDLISETDYLSKEIRALDPELIKKSIDSWDYGIKVEILNKGNLSKVSEFSGKIIMPDDDISHEFVEKYLKDKEVIFVNVFLRWDRRNSVRENKIVLDQKVTKDEFSRNIIKLASSKAEKSSDWWRHVGAVIIKDGEVVLSGCNHHVPSEHMPYINGDPRNCFHKGECLDLSTAVHAEAGLIAEAARKGISLEGTEIFVTTFPCPPCAKLIAYSGIKKIYYSEGYGVLDGEDIMKNKGIEIVFVE